MALPDRGTCDPHSHTIKYLDAAIAAEDRLWSTGGQRGLLHRAMRPRPPAPITASVLIANTSGVFPSAWIEAHIGLLAPANRDATSCATTVARMTAARMRDVFRWPRWRQMLAQYLSPAAFAWSSRQEPTLMRPRRRIAVRALRYTTSSPPSEIACRRRCSFYDTLRSRPFQAKGSSSAPAHTP